MPVRDDNGTAAAHGIAAVVSGVLRYLQRSSQGYFCALVVGHEYKKAAKIPKVKIIHMCLVKEGKAVLLGRSSVAMVSDKAF